MDFFTTMLGERPEVGWTPLRPSDRDVIRLWRVTHDLRNQVTLIASVLPATYEITVIVRKC